MSNHASSVSIRTLYAALVALAIVVTSILVGVVMQHQSDKAALNLQKVLFSHVAQSVSEHVAAHFDHGLRMLREFAYQAETGKWKLDDQESMAAYFAERLRFQNNLAWISISIDQTGCFSGAWLDKTLPVMNMSCPDINGGVPREYIVDSDGSRFKLNRHVNAYDPRTRPWYQAAIQTNVMIWTDVVPFHEGRLGVTVAKRINKTDGTLLGVLTVDFFTQTIERFLSAARPATSGLVFLYNGTQIIFPHGITSLESNKVKFAAMTLSHDSQRDAQLLDVEGESHVMNKTTFPEQMNGTWSCAVLTPRRELIAMIRPYHRIALWSVVAVCFSVLALGSFITIRIAKPLRHVLSQLQGVAKGHFDDVPMSDLSLIREVQYIQQAVEYMKQCLKERTLIEHAKLQAEQLSRDKSDFAAMISHEVRSPIQVILGYSELLQAKNLETSDDAREYANTIYNSTLELLELVNNLLNLFKMEAGRYELRRELVSLDEVVMSCINSVIIKSKTKGIGLAFQSYSPGLQLVTDSVVMKQIIMNLLTNAIKFTDAGSVTVSTNHAGDRRNLMVLVRDTGIGMTEEEISRIFSHYDQANPSIAHRYGGTGLGLSICLKFTTMLGGVISCTSSPGQGSCFTLTLPVAHADRVDDA